MLKLRHQSDFDGGEGLRDGALDLGCLSNLLERDGIDARNLAFGFELYAGDRPPVTGPKWTVAVVWMRVAAWPFCDSAADRAIEKHAA